MLFIRRRRYSAITVGLVGLILLLGVVGVSPTLAHERVTGTVKWFNDQKGYGFITRDTGGEVFVHNSSIEWTGLRSLGAGVRSTEDLRRQVARTQELTQRPFAINHTVSTLNEEAFDLTLEAKPALISFALSDPGVLVKRAHDAGILVMHQITTVQQARQAAEQGVDVIIAQGSEAGGFGGTIAGLALIPQVVDAVSPIPVIAAGGIAEGRGLAAALVLGAQGINIGTRFLASIEAPINDGWKQAIQAAESEDAIKVEVWNDFLASISGEYGTVPRSLSSPFIEEWRHRRDDAKREAERIRTEVMAAVEQARLGELMPFTGQTAGMIREILPAAEIVQRIVREAEEALKRTASLVGDHVRLGANWTSGNISSENYGYGG